MSRGFLRLVATVMLLVASYGFCNVLSGKLGLASKMQYIV